MKYFLQNLFLIDFESGIGAQLMALFHLESGKIHPYMVKWRTHIQA